MLARIHSYGITGILGYPVVIEVDISTGLPAFELVGLPDAAVKESRERVRSAIKNSDFNYPNRRITINLAPADVRKEGPIYDLPMAIGLLCAQGDIKTQHINKFIIVGELSLNGDTRAVAGILPMIIDAYNRGARHFIVPKDNAEEAAYSEDVHIYPAENLSQVVSFLNEEDTLQRQPTIRWGAKDHNIKITSTDMTHIKGQRGAKRAMEIAAAGGHNMLLIGPPGTGKTMLARALPGILPEITFNEALEVTQIHSVANIDVKRKQGIVESRPFRSPHHNASTASLVGGGTRAKPGEVSLAHNGVLFLDELPEFSRDALEALRQPIEDGIVNVARVYANVSYPARFMLVASMNPCPCGQFGSGACRCTPTQIQRYLSRISGPLLDRIDIQVEMGAVSYQQIAGRGESEETTQVVKKRVDDARKRQIERYKEDDIFSNAQLNGKLTKQYCIVEKQGQELLSRAFSAMEMSARAYSRILKVAKTIADLAGEDMILQAHVAEAIQYRSLDRKYWGQ